VSWPSGVPGRPPIRLHDLWHGAASLVHYAAQVTRAKPSPGYSLVMRTFDDGEPVGPADHDALITAWRLLAARLDSEPGDTFDLPGPRIQVIDGQVHVWQDDLARLVRSVADLGLGAMLTTAALVLGEDSAEEDQRAHVRAMIESHLADQTLDAHAADLDE
jgi:hypothetical protein